MVPVVLIPSCLMPRDAIRPQAEVAVAAQRLTAISARVSELEAALAAATSSHQEALTALQHKLTAMEKEAVAARTSARQLEQQVRRRGEAGARGWMWMWRWT